MIDDNIRDLIIKSKIEGTLKNYTILYERFYMQEYYCYEQIYKSYIKIVDIIENVYPDKHLFKRDKFLFDEILFSLAYCDFICDKYLGNRDIMSDFINKKLKSTYKGKFDIKTYNENLSEFMIFFFLFTSIFFKSDLYNNFKRLEYESEGADNKRFEYTFVLVDKRINVEVKALECDPFIKDNISINGLKDGDLFIKSYFPNVEINKFIKPKYLENIKTLSSNYRQLKKNIKRIKDKCNNKTSNDINLGFIIINYGTSREEYFSYLFNSKKGIIGLNKPDKIDGIILFSMCTATTLLFEEVYERNHVLTTLLNDNLYNNNLFRKLRLDNYIYKNGNVVDKLKDIVEEEYQLYKFIFKNNMITIESCYIDDEVVEFETNSLYKKLHGDRDKLIETISNMKF